MVVSFIALLSGPGLFFEFLRSPLDTDRAVSRINYLVS
jgi:hypothetical protein